MAYFPFFEDIAGKKCLVVGGGQVALRKVKKLLAFGPEITAVAPDFCSGFEALDTVHCISSAYEAGMENGFFMVIAATDDRELNAAVSKACRGKGIAVNSATGKENSSFLFPAIVQRGLLTVGISSGGAGPDAATAVKEQLEKVLPAHTEEIFDWMQELRPAMVRRIPDVSVRGKILRRLYDHAAGLDRPLTDEETEEILHEYSF